MPDVKKILEKAEKLVQKGQLDEAIQEYLAAWKQDPDNDGVVETVADLYIRQQKAPKALDCLGYLFDRHRQNGDDANAVAVFHKMLKLGTPDPARLLEAARLLEKSQAEEAGEHYRNAAQLFLEQGDKTHAVEALVPLAALQANNVDVQFRLGEVAQDAGQKEVAAAAFLRAAELRRGPRALPLFERAHQLAPEDPRATLRFAQSLAEGGAPERTIALLRAYASSAASVPAEILQLLADTCLATADLSGAENALWQLAASRPDAHLQLFRVAEGYLDQHEHTQAVALLGRLRQAMLQAKRSTDLVNECERLFHKGHAGSEFLEFLAGLYGELSYESKLHDCLRLLFDLHFAEGKFLKAADVLDRMGEMDPYEPDNSKRLQRLSGKIDARRWQAISGRFQKAAPAAPAARRSQPGPAAAAAGEAGEEPESNVLEDLMLQAEIFLQYGLKSRARERLERIQKLFPGEEEKNEKLHSLFATAGLEPGAAAAPAAPAGGGAAAAETAAEDVVDIARVSEITRNIYRQGTVKGVLFAAVNDVGRTWRVSKCVTGLCAPGKPPSAVLEYCAPGTKQSDVVAIVKLVSSTLQMVEDGNPLSVEDAEASPKLTSLAPLVKSMGIRSLLVLPLMDAEQPQGVLLLEQCDHRRHWRPNEVMVLKTIADQVVMATTHVKLRSLMKSLAVTDERTGMLNRKSYIECLLTETTRAQKQSGRLSVLLMQFGRANQLIREHGEEAVRGFMDDAGQAVVAHLRQSDVAIKYDSTTLALVLPDTKGQDVFIVIDKMRKLLGGMRVSEKTPPLTCGVAEAILDSGMDPVDSVTELINRTEEALDAAQKEGANTGKLLEPPLMVAAH